MSRKRDAIRVMLRLPPEQKTFIEEQADLNLTSMNAEIVRSIRLRMEEAVRRAEGTVG
jgi:uncharacterized protein (DUF1778 family)